MRNLTIKAENISVEAESAKNVSENYTNSPIQQEAY